MSQIASTGLPAFLSDSEQCDYRNLEALVFSAENDYRNPSKEHKQPNVKLCDILHHDP